MLGTSCDNKSLRPRKPEGSLGRTAQDVHLDSHTAPELWLTLFFGRSLSMFYAWLRVSNVRAKKNILHRNTLELWGVKRVRYTNTDTCPRDVCRLLVPRQLTFLFFFCVPLFIVEVAHGGGFQETNCGMRLFSYILSGRLMQCAQYSRVSKNSAANVWFLRAPRC